MNAPKKSSGESTMRTRSIFFLRRLLVHRFSIKLLCFFFAILLFLYVQYTSRITSVVDISVIPPELPIDLIFTRKYPSFIPVTFSGKEEGMGLDFMNFHITLDNPNPLPGSNMYRVQLHPDVPEGLQAEYKRELRLFIDRFYSRELSVVPKVTLNLSPEHELGYVNVNPRSVVMQGPYELLANMDHVETEELTIEETNDVIVRRILIARQADYINFAPNQPFQVELSINILSQNRSEYSVIENVPLSCINETPRLQLHLGDKVRVNIYRNPSTIALREEEKQAYVFCPVFFDEETQSIRPSFFIPKQPVFTMSHLGSEDLQIVKIEPPLLDLEFRKSASDD